MSTTASKVIDRLKTRLAAAKEVNKQAEAAWKGLEKIPSFNGKAKYMDKVRAIVDSSHNLAWELGIDLSEAEGTPAGS